MTIIIKSFEKKIPPYNQKFFPKIFHILINDVLKVCIFFLKKNIQEHLIIFRRFNNKNNSRLKKTVITLLYLRSIIND